jgi:hypothetical protein
MPLSLVIPGRFHAGWSPLGRALRSHTGDRLRAETLQIVLLTGGALAWLMGVYAGEVLADLLALPPLALWAGLAGTGLLLVLVGGVGFCPPVVVTCSGRAVRVERGRERLRLPYAALTTVETVDAREYHRHHRHYAAVRPFLNGSRAPVLLLQARGGPVVALGLREQQHDALLQHIADERRARDARHEAIETVRS